MPPRLSLEEKKALSGLPGSSMRELVRLVDEGASIADLAWVAVFHFDRVPANEYITEAGLLTKRGESKVTKTAMKKAAADTGNWAIGFARSLALIDLHVRDYMRSKRAERRVISAPFTDMTVAQVMELAAEYRAEYERYRQTPELSSVPLEDDVG